jgi:hypothetical protein
VHRGHGFALAHFVTLGFEAFTFDARPRHMPGFPLADMVRTSVLSFAV